MKTFGNKLVASCQDKADWTIRKAIEGGCGGLRVNAPDGVRSAAYLTATLPIIACWKQNITGYEIRITPFPDLVRKLADAGADYIAFDATHRRRPYDVRTMVKAIHDCNRKAVADVATYEEALVAHSYGADIVATTLFPRIDLGAIKSLSSAGILVMAEGGIRTPDMAKKCVNVGAELVCVGSAISRPHHITSWFVEELEK